MKQWYEKLFTNYAKSYDKEEFTKGTITEVDFIEKEAGKNKRIKVLDIGCGTGRHAIELAKRGYNVEGVDLSKSQLERARQKAKEANVRVKFQKADARKLKYKNKFDLVIMLCEGGFSLMETDRMNYRILERASKALKKKGKLIFTCLNALYPIFHDLKEFFNANEKSNTFTTKCSFDPLTLREKSVYKVKDDKGKEKLLQCNERFFMPTEIRWHLETLGFSKIDTLGCDIGVYSREKNLTVNDFEMLVVAEK